MQLVGYPVVNDMLCSSRAVHMKYTRGGKYFVACVNLRNNLRYIVSLLVALIEIVYVTEAINAY